MSAYVKTVKDAGGDIIYPQTKVSAIYDANNDSLQSLLNGKTESSVLNILLTVANWSNNSQTVTASGVTANNSVIVSPAPVDVNKWLDNQILCTSQAVNSLTFTCDTIPDSSVSVNVLIVN